MEPGKAPARVRGKKLLSLVPWGSPRRQKEPEHRASGVGSSRVGIGAVRASARPCVSGTMHEPMLQGGFAGRDGPGISAPALLALLYCPGRKQLLAVSRMNSG